MTFDFAELIGPAWSQLAQVSVMILAVGLATRLFCRARPHLAYVLWLLVIIKCLTPPVWSSPTGVFSWTMARRAATAVVETPRTDAPIVNMPIDNMPAEATPVVISPLIKGATAGLSSSAYRKLPESTAGQASSGTLAHRMDLATIVGILWLAGAAIHAGILIAMRLGWSWQLWRSRVSARPDWTAMLENLSRQLGVRRKVRLLVTSQPVGPAVFGLFRPTLVMPEAVLAEGNTSKLKAVLAHELLHIRRGDTIVGLLQLLAQTLWWFHPLVWWANREQSHQRERCCDEEVLAGLDCEPAEYAQSLIDLLKLKRSLRPIIAFPGIRPVEVASKRLESIMDSTQQFRRRTPRWYWLALAVGILIFAPGAGLTLGDSTPPTLPTTSPPLPAKVANPVGKRVDLEVVVAKHVLLLDGKKIISWDELEKRIAALPDPSQAYPHFYITRGVMEADTYNKAKEKIWHLHKKFKLKGHSEGSLWPRADFRYDRIKTAKDLVADESLRAEGRVVDGKGELIADAEVLLIAPVDKSIPYKSYHVALVEGRVRNQLEHVMTRSDAKGQFVLYPPKDMKSYVVALHPTAGFTLQRGKQLFDGGNIRLMPWASLESRFDGGEAQQQGASLSTRVREKDGFPEVVFNQDSNSQKGVKKDSPAGMFRFTHVPPIFATTISRMFPGEQGSSFSSTGATVGLLPGESRRLDLAPMSNKQQEWLERIRNMSRSRSEKPSSKSTSEKGNPDAKKVESAKEGRKPAEVKPEVAKPTTGGIRPMDLLNIRAINTLIGHPINGTYLVDPSGQVSLGPAYGRVRVKGLSAEEAEGPVERKLAETLRGNPKASVTRAGRVTFWTKAILPKAPYRIKPGDEVHINVLNTLVSQPINSDYLVEPSGKVSLGPEYKRVQINGMTFQEAEAAIKKHLEKILREPEVAVTMANWKRGFLMTLPTAPYRITPGDRLKIKVFGTLVDQPIDAIYLIEPSGKVCLGPAYGRVQLMGMSVQGAEAAIKKHLQSMLREPEVYVIRGGWMRTTSREATMDRTK